MKCCMKRLRLTSEQTNTVDSIPYTCTTCVLGLEKLLAEPPSRGVVVKLRLDNQRRSFLSTLPLLFCYMHILQSLLEAPVTNQTVAAFPGLHPHNVFVASACCVPANQKQMCSVCVLQLCVVSTALTLELRLLFFVWQQ